MLQTSGKFTQKKGLKPTMLDLRPNESVIFSRQRFGTLRNTISLLKVEYPDRCFQYEVIDEGIRVMCLK